MIHIHFRSLGFRFTRNRHRKSHRSSTHSFIGPKTVKIPACCNNGTPGQRTERLLGRPSGNSNASPVRQPCSERPGVATLSSRTSAEDGAANFHSPFYFGRLFLLARSRGPSTFFGSLIGSGIARFPPDHARNSRAPAERPNSLPSFSSRFLLAESSS